MDSKIKIDKFSHIYIIEVSVFNVLEQRTFFQVL
jgi:hypothetical protein